MSRIRLTSKTRIANDPADMEGNRQDCGKKTRMLKYDNFDIKDDSKPTDSQKHVKNLHKKDVEQRDEMNVGKLRQAKAWQASKLATKLAIYLLGQKAPSSMVKAQAAQFLSLGNSKLAKAVNRFAKTEYLYAEEEQEVVQEKVEQAPAQSAEQEVVQEKVEQAPAQSAEQEVVQEKVEQAPAQSAEQEVVQEKAEQKQDKCEGQECKCEQACVACGDVSASPQEQLVEQGAEAQDEQLDDAALASLFEQNSNNLVASKKVVAFNQKVGVQKLSQPKVKVASNTGVNLEEIWESAPDVSQIFN